MAFLGNNTMSPLSIKLHVYSLLNVKFGPGLSQALNEGIFTVVGMCVIPPKNNAGPPKKNVGSLSSTN